MSIERSGYAKELEKKNMSDEVTAERIHENLQIDGLKPSLSRVKIIISKIKGRRDGPRAPKSSA